MRERITMRDDPSWEVAPRGLRVSIGIAVGLSCPVLCALAALSQRWYSIVLSFDIQRVMRIANGHFCIRAHSGLPFGAGMLLPLPLPCCY